MISLLKSSIGTIQSQWRIFFFSVVFLLFIKNLCAQQTSVLQQNGVTLLFDEPLRPAAEEAIKLYPVIKTELEKTLGWEVSFMPTIILISDKNTFQNMTGNDLIVAYALPDKDMMVIDYSRMNTDPFTLEATIEHELCHLILHKNIRHENLPRWLDEGVAQWVSGGLADIIIDQYSVLDDAILSNRYISLKVLAKGFPDNEKLLPLAYAESKSLIDYIIIEYGPGGVLELLDYLKDGEEIDSAILKSYSISFDELEKRWYAWLKKRATFVTFLINNLYEILFFLAALLLIYGFIKGLIKKKSYEEEEDNFDIDRNF